MSVPSRWRAAAWPARPTLQGCRSASTAAVSIGCCASCLPRGLASALEKGASHAARPQPAPWLLVRCSAGRPGGRPPTLLSAAAAERALDFRVGLAVGRDGGEEGGSAGGGAGYNGIRATYGSAVRSRQAGCKVGTRRLRRKAFWPSERSGTAARLLADGLMAMEMLRVGCRGVVARRRRGTLGHRACAPRRPASSTHDSCGARRSAPRADLAGIMLVTRWHEVPPKQVAVAIIILHLLCARNNVALLHHALVWFLSDARQRICYVTLVCNAGGCGEPGVSRGGVEVLASYTTVGRTIKA